MTTSVQLELLQAVRNPERIRSSHLIPHLVDGFVPMRSPDPALIAGSASLDGLSVLVLAQEKPKGRSAKAAQRVNFGMMSASGYWFAIRAMHEAANAGMGLLTLIDTPGADPSKEGVERRLPWAISKCIWKIMCFPGPSVSVIIGEGGSGGALALQITDTRLMASDAIYSVISPESCSSILFRDNHHVEQSMNLLRPGVEDALRIGVIDAAVDWSGALAVVNPAGAAARLSAQVVEAMRRAGAMKPAERCAQRMDRILRCGRIADVAAPLRAAPPFPAAQREVPSVRLTRFGDGTSELQCDEASGGCGAIASREACEQNGWECPSCGRGERISAQRWLELLTGGSNFHELYADLDYEDLDVPEHDAEAYRAQRARARAASGARESLITGIARLDGRPCALAISEFGYFGGTLGAVAGEKLRLLCERAREELLPLVVLTSSGGARMQEGTLALVQMAKTNAAVGQLMEAGLPYLSVLLDPCTGGALASYATHAHKILAERHALIAFAGPRVMQLAGFHTNSELLNSDRIIDYGGIDEVVARSLLKARITAFFGSRRLGGKMGNVLARIETGIDDADPVDGNGDLVNGLVDLALVHVPLVLERAARSEDPVVRARAEAALARFPALESTALEEQLRAHDPVQRRAALFSLSRHPSEQLRPLVQAAGGDPDVSVRVAAAMALCCYGELGAARQALDMARAEIGVRADTLFRRMMQVLPKQRQGTAATMIAEPVSHHRK
jgi:acetyl-CoA carboxylase carboxyl transferase beta subunit